MRNIPTITKNLLIINLLMFVAGWALIGHGYDLNEMLGLHFFMADEFRPYQFLTYMFMHGGWEHLFFNMFALWMFGGIIERTLGPQRYILYYLVCGIGAGLCQELAQYIHYLQLDLVDVQNFGQTVKCVNLEGYSRPVMLSSYLSLWNCVGASGSIYGILLAFGMLYPNERMFIIPIPVPIKAKYLVLGYAVIELMDVLTSAHDGVAHIAHLGGMIFGVLLILYWRSQDNRNNRSGGATYVTFDSNYQRY